MIDELRWLHLSDLHLRLDGDVSQQNRVVRDLAEALQRELRSFGPVHFALVSGDVAFSGKPEEYRIATEALDLLRNAIDLPASKIFVVPGNHDVDRTVAKLPYVGARMTLKAQEDVDGLLGDRGELELLLARQKPFWDFVRSLHDAPDRTWTPSRLGYSGVVVIDGFRVAVAGLNTAWLSGPHDSAGELILGECQALEVLDSVEKEHSHLVLAIGHHPLAWLRDWDRRSCEDGLLPKIDVYHRGHEHEPGVVLAGPPNDACVVVAGGAAFMKRSAPNSFNLLRFDIGGGTLFVNVFEYHPAKGDFENVAIRSSRLEPKGHPVGEMRSLAEAIRAVCPQAAGHEHLIANILVHRSHEVPVATPEGPGFAPEDIAHEEVTLPKPSLAILRVRRLLRLYPKEMSVEDCLRQHASELHEFAGLLSELTAADPDFRRLCSSKEAVLVKTARSSPSEARPHAQAWLDQAIASGDSGEIRTVADRLIRSDIPDLVASATRALIPVLLQSGQSEDLSQAAALANHRMSLSDANWEDWVLAAAVFEAEGRPDQAVENLRMALARWEDCESLRSEVAAAAKRLDDRNLYELAKRGQPSGSTSDE